MIHPTAIIADGAVIDPNCEIGPFCIVSSGAKLGAYVRLHNNVTLMGDVTLGAGCELFPFAVLGAPAQHIRADKTGAKLILGEKCIVREHVTMHAGTALGDGATRIGDRGLFMACAHVAHDCRLGNDVIMTNYAGVGGHSLVGDNVNFGAAAITHQHTRIGRGAFLGQGAVVNGDVIPFGMVVGNPARLAGLNIVGLKRRGFSRETIHQMRAAYRALFAREGTFQERLEEASLLYAAQPEIREILDFIRVDAERALCFPDE